MTLLSGLSQFLPHVFFLPWVSLEDCSEISGNYVFDIVHPPMTKITLYRDGKPHEYTNAHDITISPAGVLTFHWEIQEGGSFKKPRAYKMQTSVPFVVEEDVARA